LSSTSGRSAIFPARVLGEFLARATPDGSSQGQDMKLQKNGVVSSILSHLRAIWKYYVSIHIDHRFHINFTLLFSS